MKSSNPESSAQEAVKEQLGNQQKEKQRLLSGEYRQRAKERREWGMLLRVPERMAFKKPIG